MTEDTRLNPVGFGPFTLDLHTGELRKHGARIRLEGQPIQILDLLLVRPGELVTQDEIRCKLWPDGTVVEYEHSIKTALRKLRHALGDDAGEPRYIETLPRRGYRFIAPVISIQGEAPAESRVTPARPRDMTVKRWPFTVASGAVAILAGLAVGGYFYFHRAPGLTDKDTIVVADFDNTTSDTVFDSALRQGLSVQLEQSPFLSLVSEARVQQTLGQMGQPAGAQLRPEIAREVCQRTGGTAVIDGSIARLGNQYVIGLKALECRTGETLAEEQNTAGAREQVLRAMDEAAAKLRGKLGESLTTVQKFATPIEQATTPSLEALQAYSLGMRLLKGKSDFAAALPFFQRAIDLDPKFASAYSGLALTYMNLSETDLASKSAGKAYELRDTVSEPEKLWIETKYYEYVTGDLEKARQTCELWAETYPRDSNPRGIGIGIYAALGRHDRALEEARANLRLEPAIALGYGGLVLSYLALNRFDEARAVAAEAVGKGFDSSLLRANLYALDFLQNDRAGMTQQLDWALGKPGSEDLMLALEAQSAAYGGRLGKSRELSRRAVAAALRADEKETAALYETAAAQREALFGNPAEASKRADAALALSSGRDVEYGAALALALSGEGSGTQERIERLITDLQRRFPEDTLAQLNYLPALRAQLALNRKHPSQAIEALHAAAPYELGAVGAFGAPPALFPIYTRGQAYLAAHKGEEAAAEFQKVLDHPGLALNEPIGALARLELGRSFAMEAGAAQNEQAAAFRAKARSFYRDFLTLWKDADPDIPVLRSVRAELH
jgi:DNA-binding winged helix-turn-helix (wHTH) protein/tetratricopeptide (TPR) repeat protein